MSYDPEQYMCPSSGIGVSLGLWALVVLGLLALDHGRLQAGPESSSQALAIASRCGPATAEHASPPQGTAHSPNSQVHAS
jgi:hypothetical protein